MTDKPKPHVDILCVVDGESLLRDFPGGFHFPYHDPDKTIRKYCRMITRDRNSLNHHTDDAELVVRGKVGDIVRWRATSLTLDEECDVEITEFYGFDEGVCETPENRPTNDPMEHQWVTRIVQWSSQVESYWLKFKVVAYDENGTPIKEAEFDWDPGIKVER